MDFHTAKIVSETLHYIVTVGFAVIYLKCKSKDLVTLVKNFYILFFIWGVLCFLFGGCPITRFENYISYKIYGCEFYPGYTFNNSDFYSLLTNKDLYIPLVLLTLDKIINYDYNSRNGKNNISNCVTTPVKRK